MKKTFFESGKSIELEGEIIIKFDQHKYYKHFSGQGFKGVDFLVVSENYLYLIEIKNFQQFPNTKRPSKIQLNQKFYEKCENTLEIIEKFYQYLYQNPIRKLIFLKWKLFWLGNKEWKEWYTVYDTYQKGQVICILETQ